MYLKTIFRGSKKCKCRNYFTYCAELTQPVKNQPKWCDANRAFEKLRSNQTVFCGGAAATPIVLLNAMTEHGKVNKLKNIMVCHMHTEGPASYAHHSCEGIFRLNSFFISGNVRKAIAEGRGDNISVFLNEIPKLFYQKIIKPDIGLCHVSPPDKHGFCSLGTSVECVRAGLVHSKIIIAQVNKRMCRTFGDAIIHSSHFDYAVQVDEPLPTHPEVPPSDIEVAIGKLIADNLVVDGATIQTGIGNIPDAILSQLGNHKNLGIHSEMFSTGVIDLIDKGAITNNEKKLHRGRIVGTFLLGPQRLYDYVDNNPLIEMMNVEYVNDTKVISQQPKMTALNSCIEIDLTGQVVSDSIGTKFFSGFGGQVDFIRGAAEGFDGLGKPIIAFQSCTKKGDSKICSFIKQGAGVVTTRAHAHYIVTEYGIAYLFGKNMRQRAHALINIAHPEHRERLEQESFARLKVMPSP